jgi:serine phosphatase RsbU (regulator of sigma subunit)
LPQHFVFYKPRDIVSGDFYFVKKINNQIVIAVADCTGHGVPGALLSMLGVASLNELVLRAETKSPGNLLNELRNQLKSSLQQTGRKGEQQDGIDISLCIINLDTNCLTFSGAYNPILIFQSSTETFENQSDSSQGHQKCIEIKADRQPVGVYLREFPFTEQTFQLQKGDVIYLFTDGFYSQFGGAVGEKYKSVKLKKFLENIYHLPMDEQKDAVEKEFYQWKGHNEQTDDVLLMSVKI